MRGRLSFFVLSLPLFSLAQEVCDNGIDDDGNGLIDLNDPACACSTLITPEGTPSYIRNHSFEEQLCCPYGFVFDVPWLSCAAGWHQATSATSDYFHSCGYAPIGMPLPPPDGEGAVGFFAMPGYQEYVGTCLTYPEPSNPLLAGVTYTLSLWIAGAGANGQFTHTPEQGDASVFKDKLPLAIFGYANACVPFPIGTQTCIGYLPGWQELGRTLVQPSSEWTRVSMTFTPAQEIHSVIIGGACDVPASFIPTSIVDSQGRTETVMPYFIVDDLMLTIAADQVLTPVSTTGGICTGDAMVTASPPPTATGHQWYLNGVAIPGQTSLTLDISAAGLDGGMYALASTFQGQCLMGSTFVVPATDPAPWSAIDPIAGCVPLEVSFRDTTGRGTTTVEWSFGDGSTSADSATSHVYTVPGVYDVRLSVRDVAGCVGDTLLVDAVTVHPRVGGGITASPNPANAPSPVVTLSGSSTSGDVVSWWWDLGPATPGTSTDRSFTATFPEEPGTYPVMLVVTSAAGCVDTVRSTVVVLGDIEMPNVFSPNGDGSNDRFIPLKDTGATGLLEVYNRWGQLVFSTRSLAQGWDGADAPDGTYFFVVTPDDPELEKSTGHVTLLR